MRHLSNLRLNAALKHKLSKRERDHEIVSCQDAEMVLLQSLPQE